MNETPRLINLKPTPSTSFDAMLLAIDKVPRAATHLFVRGESEVSKLAGCCRNPGPAVRPGDRLLGLRVECDPTLPENVIELRYLDGTVRARTRIVSFESEP